MPLKIITNSENYIDCIYLAKRINRYFATVHFV